MEHDFPGAVPEIPVSDVDTAAAYYKNQLGFSLDWSSEDGGIAGISKGSCRMFLTNRALYLVPSQSRGSCMSSRSQTWMATCFAFSTTFRGRPAEYELRDDCV